MSIDQGAASVGNKATRLADYRPADFLIDHVELRFELADDQVRVKARSQVLRRTSEGGQLPLILAGHDMRLAAIRIDDRALAPEAYRIEPQSLTIAEVPEHFVLEIETILRPQDNTSLMGLFQSGGNFCTQCEAEGFRKITYFLDRPDVLARYTTTIVADQARYPVLLSNGNLQEQGSLSDGRHYATWHDPFPKPSYLFALVAGDLACIQDKFVTCSGRDVDLRIYVQHHNKDKCAHAMSSVKRAMQWDEDVYGREYDLDVYMIVAVDDFNMGAMENKGLNVFNSKYVLASPQTATDGDYQAIEAIIGHEYFHNWSGNRVTCRDWFQLSLKEGFTVFRDQEFSADVHSRGVKRVQDVNYLRNYQFREDAGPMAHPVRPAAYVEINNFYTSTVYQKGAEVVRMLARLVGRTAFRRGTDLYFSRFDGQAVTTDDFVDVMEEVSGLDLLQFRRWYSQSGTPELTVEGKYDATEKTYTLNVKQSCPPTPGQSNKQPFHIPLAVALFQDNGEKLNAQLRGNNVVAQEHVLSVTGVVEQFVFDNIARQPVPSLLRGFSAPVKLTASLRDEDWFFLMRHDDDEFCRWEASQHWVVQALLGTIKAGVVDDRMSLDPRYLAAFEATLTDPQLDKSFAAQVLSLPEENYIGEFMAVIEPDKIHQACRTMRRKIAQHTVDVLKRVYQQVHDGNAYAPTADEVAKRRLKNTCLSYLMELNDAPARALCIAQYHQADNMTDSVSPLIFFANTECAERAEVLDDFYRKWRNDPLVMDKWLAIQASSRLPSALHDVRRLMENPVYNPKNPNKVRALIGAFCHSNAVNFHHVDGSGYAFLAEQVLALDAVNPQIAARLAAAMSLWRRYDAQRQALMKMQLERIGGATNLSRDVSEIVAAALA